MQVHERREQSMKKKLECLGESEKNLTTNVNTFTFSSSSSSYPLPPHVPPLLLSPPPHHHHE